MASKTCNKLDKARIVFKSRGLGCPQHQSSEQGRANLVAHALTGNSKQREKFPQGSSVVSVAQSTGSCII